jgi:hypothetical protein
MASKIYKKFEGKKRMSLHLLFSDTQAANTGASAN